MATLRFVGLYSLAFVCTFAWLWRFFMETLTGRRSPRPLWPAWEFSPRYVAMLLQRIFYCSFGVLLAVAIILLMLFVLVPRL